MTPNIDAIIAELSEATGPSREMDFLIAEALADDKDHWQGCRVRQERWYEMSDYKAGDPIPVRWEWSQPVYTGSIDAALTLAEPNWWLQCGGPLSPAAYGYSREEDRKLRAGFQMIGPPYSSGAQAATLPLAICIAALRVRSAFIGEVGRDG